MVRASKAPSIREEGSSGESEVSACPVRDGVVPSDYGGADDCSSPGKQDDLPDPEKDVRSYGFQGTCIQ